MPASTVLKYSFLASLFLFCMCLTGYAQFNAGFTVNKPGGCSPVALVFTNTTIGASSAAVYEWNFDNGNTSSLKNPSAIFVDERNYNVILTVKDSGKSSIYTEVVSVYKKPVVNFSVDVQKGCAPLAVTFTSSSSTENGTLTDFFWDFGDGTTGQSGSPQISHPYLWGQKPPIILAVTNSYGCSANKTISNLLEVLPGAVASFDADKTFLCFETDPVKMINRSTGSEPLIYTWNFGDGAASAAKEPVHSFNKRGTFTVSLTVENSYGCRDTVIKSSYLNAANFQSAFTVPDFICNESAIELKNSSIPEPSSFIWVIDGKDTVSKDNWDNFYRYRFTVAGNHTIQLTNTFGTCTDTISKTVNVKALLQPKGFVADIPVYCFPPVTVAFHDTTTGAVKSEWNFERLSYPFWPTASGKDANFTFMQPSNSLVTLFVTDVNGCVDTVEQYVKITQPQVFIRAIDSNKFDGCLNLTKQFSFETDEQLTSLTWDFGDSTTSSDSSPLHVFKPGQYGIRLTYTTSKGCTGTTYLYDIVRVFVKSPTEFVSTSGTTICGNSITWFKTIDYHISDYWIIDGEYAGMSYYDRFDYQFKDTGLHTVMHIVYNDGCRDTMTRVDYIRVLPSFPKISEVKNTCDGDRGTVTFKQASRYAENWVWDFGDSVIVTLNTDQEIISHKYSKSGKYKVVLTTINGQCEVRDSVFAYVLLKQYPLLSASKTVICKDEGLSYSLTGLTMQPYDGYWLWDYLDRYEYNDGTFFSTFSNDWDGSWIFTDPYTNTFNNIPKGKDSIRVIIREAYFNCLDTSNFIPIKLLGADAGFKILTDTVCYGTPVIFNDTSNSYNANIINREWNFGDGDIQTTTSGGTLSHTYTEPGAYNVTLKVTDDAGCTSTTSLATHQVIVNGPKAAFTASETNVQLNTTVEFTNTSNTFNANNTVYKWQFEDGASSTDYSPGHTYPVAGNYQAMLIATSNETGCIDTAIQLIRVNNFNAGFTFSKSFIQNSNCPPVLYSFTNTSINYTYLRWDFGDGTIVENTGHPGHLYTASGKYIIRLFVKGNNGLEDTYTDSVVINKTILNISANPMHSCTAQTITMSAATKKATSFTWDFGDGAIKQTTDTFSTHLYSQAGIYAPHLIVTDSNGCSSSLSLNDKIVIDSLHISLGNLPQGICSPKEILFNPTVVSIAGNQSPQNLNYHWDFGTGKPADTSNVTNPSFLYQSAGNYQVNLKVQSLFGCEKDEAATITTLQGLGPQINGPAGICEGNTAQFNGATQLPGQPQWKWIFDDGSIVQQQNPPARLYNNAGVYPVKLIVDNGGCADTVTRSLQVNQKPAVGLSLKQATLCEGSSIVITASGGSLYSWSPAAGLNNTNFSTITASPVTNTNYTVTVTNDNGCVNKDAVSVAVVHPFSLQLLPEAVVCKGKNITLNATGANTYEWIQNTAGLNNTNIPNPIAAPLVTTTFTVAGTDVNNCFTDTASIKVTVLPSPFVEAGQNVMVLTGAPYQLQPAASSDVVQWNWSPGEYLSCINCADPLVKASAPVMYTVTVSNAAGCSASDTVSVNLLCSESRIYIPAAFSPNDDGVNDLFVIKGQGIRIVNHLTIFNRYGLKIFERSNFQAGDINAAWNGRYKGEPVSAGSYVYIAEMSCNEKTFTQKGSVIVVY